MPGKNRIAAIVPILLIIVCFCSPIASASAGIFSRFFGKFPKSISHRLAPATVPVKPLSRAELAELNRLPAVLPVDAHHGGTPNPTRLWLNGDTPPAELSGWFSGAGGWHWVRTEDGKYLLGKKVWKGFPDPEKLFTGESVSGIPLTSGPDFDHSALIPPEMTRVPLLGFPITAAGVLADETLHLVEGDFSANNTLRYFKLYRLHEDNYRPPEVLARSPGANPLYPDMSLTDRHLSLIARHMRQVTGFEIYSWNEAPQMRSLLSRLLLGSRGVKPIKLDEQIFLYQKFLHLRGPVYSPDA